MKPLVSLQLETTGLVGAWEHCDQIANYLAQLASHDRTDSFLYANLLSTILNELLEVVFTRHAPRDAVRCTISRAGASDQITLRIPVDEESRAFYQRSVAAAQRDDVGDLYAHSLLDREDPAVALGFLELASDYRARFSLHDSEADTYVDLQLSVELEDGGTAPALLTPAK